MVPLQEALQDLKVDLQNEKEENRIMHCQLQEAHKQVLLQGTRQTDLEAALTQRDAEVAALRAELHQTVSTPARAPACWSCVHEAGWQSQMLPSPRKFCTL